MRFILLPPPFPNSPMKTDNSLRINPNEVRCIAVIRNGSFKSILEGAHRIKYALIQIDGVSVNFQHSNRPQFICCIICLFVLEVFQRKIGYVIIVIFEFYDFIKTV